MIFLSLASRFRGDSKGVPFPSPWTPSMGARGAAQRGLEGGTSLPTYLVQVRSLQGSRLCWRRKG